MGSFRYVCGLTDKRGSNEAHAWLVGEGLVIDITADQFGDGMPAVFVEADSDWHGRWQDVVETGPADYREWNGHALHYLEELYCEIKPELHPVSAT